MKNEIGRKITSLTLMTIMFAGGMTLAIPGFLPDSAIPIEAYADQGTTQGMLYVSSTEVQGAQVVEIKVSDPAYSSLVTHSPLTMDFNDSTITLVQVSDGSWMAYLSDLNNTVYADTNATDFEFGLNCVLTLNAGNTAPDRNLDVNVNTFSEVTTPCTGGATAQANTMSVLQNELDIAAAGAAGQDGPGTIGNVGADAALWPFIHNINFAADNYLAYGDDTVTLTYGPNNASTSLSSSHSIVVPSQKIHLTIGDNGLNIDPTTVDKWTLLGTADSQTSIRSSIGSDALTGAEMGAFGMGGSQLTITDGAGPGGSSVSVEATTSNSFIFTETGVNTGVFTTFDSLGSSDASVLSTCAVDDYVDFAYDGNTVRLICATNNASASLDAGESWMPSEAATYTVNDPDSNRNSVLVETIEISGNNIIPTIVMGDAKFLTTSEMYTADGTSSSGASFGGSDAFAAAVSVADLTDESRRVALSLTSNSTGATTSTLTIETGWDASTWGDDASEGTEVLFYDVCSISDALSEVTAIDVIVGTVGGTGAAVQEPGANECSGEIQYSGSSGTTGLNAGSTVEVAFAFTHTARASGVTAADYVIAMDLHNYNQGGAASSISRIEAVETGPDTGIFTGTVTYVQMNTVAGETGPAGFITPDGSDVIIMLDNYATGSSSPRVNFGDTDVLGSNNVTVGAQLEANTHSGVVSFGSNTYAVGDAATVTLVDADLNTDSSVVETYVGDSDGFTASTDMFSLLCDDSTCASTVTLLLVEDGADSDTFIGMFTVPDNIGADMEVAYRDSRDGAGSAVQWFATATIGSSTGTISLDRQVYPVPFGISGDTSTVINGTASSGSGLKEGDTDDLADWDGSSGSDAGSITVWVSVTDPDVTDDQLKVTAGSTAQGTCSTINAGTSTPVFTFGASAANSSASPKELGPMSEDEQGTGVYSISGTIAETENSVKIVGGTTVLQCSYVDAAGDNGLSTTVYDSSTFDLRNGSLTADKSTYIMGQDMVLTLTDEDLNLNSDSAETYVLNLIEWDSSASSSRLLSQSGDFTANPTALEETGDSTGVFQTVITIPTSVASTDLELGEEITLTYRDAGRAGESNVAAATASDTTSADVELSIAISNFGASISLDKTVYDWTDTVNIEVVAPDHNKNSSARENIGTASLPVKVSTRAGAMCSSTYTLKESGEDTGIFVGYITLTGLPGQANNGGDTQDTIADVCTGPEGGKLQTAGQDDGVTVTYEYNDGSVALASAIIQWNYSSIEFLESSVAADGTVTIRAVDPDEDLDDTVIDQITIDVYSDSDSGGITKTLSETDEGTGIFEGTINFTSTAISSGDTIRVSEGDTVTAEITDTNLPGPDYTSSDSLLFAATTTIGTAFPPLDRAPASNARVVDASGNSVAEVSVDQQVQIAADVTNGQSKDQAFAYLVQVQDASGVTVSLSWLTGSLTSGQSMTAAQSWTPTGSGSYTATVFVWESVSNPTALSPTVSVDIDVV